MVRVFHPKAAEYTFFSSLHETFWRIGHILGYKTSLGKKKKMLLNNKWITEEIKEESRSYLETYENENMTIQYLCVC